MLRLIAIAAALTSSIAAATEVTVVSGLPFAIEVGSVSEAELGGATYTVAVAIVKNGDYPTNSIDIHCQAKNADGFAWDVTGSISGLAPMEERSARLVSSTGDETGYYKDPTTLTCEVVRFDGGIR